MSFIGKNKCGEGKVNSLFAVLAEITLRASVEWTLKLAVDLSLGSNYLYITYYLHIYILKQGASELETLILTHKSIQSILTLVQALAIPSFCKEVVDRAHCFSEGPDPIACIL